MTHRVEVKTANGKWGWAFWFRTKEAAVEYARNIRRDGMKAKVRKAD